MEKKSLSGVVTVVLLILIAIIVRDSPVFY
ncbi:hypothetical protein GW923_02810 [Candidatus Pacearchaeota archaeon]|nr:hypothetical protein [Candidatus Pacearchaeota archaeon]